MKTWKLFAILSVIAGTIGYLHQGLERHRYTRAKQDFEFLPSTQQVRLLSLGHTETFAGLIWVRGILYFGSSLFEKKDTKWMEHLIDLVTTSDPKFKQAYRFLSTAIQAENMTPLGLQIQKRGIENFRDDWQLALFYSMNLIEQKEDYKQASEVMSHFKDSKDVPRYINSLSGSFKRRTIPIQEALYLYLGEYFLQNDQNFKKNIQHKTVYFLTRTLDENIQRPYNSFFESYEKKELDKVNLFNSLVELYYRDKN